MSYVNPYEDEEQPSSNYFVRNWRGQNSLVLAYWVNGSAVTLGLTTAVTLFLSAVQDSTLSLRLYAALGLLSLALVLAAWVWSSVGIWRSANRHPHRGGSGGWAVAAKVVVALGCIATVFRLPGLYLQSQELALLAAGSDSLGKGASLTVRGDGAVEVNGYLTQGVAARFAELLESKPAVRTIVLSSAGGRIREAEQMARLIKVRGIDTIAEGECASACAIPFLAGRSRLLGADGRIGFHQPAFAGESPAEHREGVEAFRNNLIEAGVEQSFARQALTAASNDMWYPEPQRLVDANVVTGLHRSAVVAANAASAKAINARGPRPVDTWTVLSGARAEGTHLELLYRLRVPAERLDRAKLRRDQAAALTAEVCGDPEQALVVRSGGSYTFSYADVRGVPVAQFDVRKC